METPSKPDSVRIINITERSHYDGSGNIYGLGDDGVLYRFVHPFAPQKPPGFWVIA